MLQYSINTGKTTQLATFYDEWDIADNEKVYDWHRVTMLDKEKYIKFDDGSNLYARIYMVSKDYIRTSAGLFRIKDIVHCSKPKYKHWGYSGASDNEESFQVRPASKNELAKTDKIVKGHKPRTATRRVRMLVLKELQSIASDAGCDDNWVMNRLKSWADGNGQHAFKSLAAICKIQGIDIEKAPEDTNAGGGSIAHRLGISENIQERRKISKKDMSVLVPVEETKESKILNSDGVYKSE